MSDRIEELEETVQMLTERMNEAEEERDELREQLADEREERERVEQELQEEREERERVEAVLNAVRKRIETSREMIGELQSRELEKGAHLDWGNVKPTINDDYLEVDAGRVEKISRDDGTQAARVPGGEDAISSSGVALAPSDLLPIQQVARLDDDMLQSEARPVRLAAQLWRERDEDRSPWSDGSGKVREYADAGEIKTWIRTRESGVSEDYAKKLAGRTIDALLDLSNDRLYDELRNRRTDGLNYKERRLIVPADSEIPGETHPANDDPGTTVVAGD